MCIKIGLFFGSTTCYTEMAGEKIREKIDMLIGYPSVTLHNIAFNQIDSMSKYEFMIFGIPTWDYGELQEDWEKHWEAIDSVYLQGKVIALYGLGDQVGYPDWFQDAMGYLWHKVRKHGAQTIGAWPNKNYYFNDSKALNEEKTFFVGLALDDENQSHISDARITRWCKQIIEEYCSLKK